MVIIHTKGDPPKQKKQDRGSLSEIMDLRHQSSAMCIIMLRGEEVEVVNDAFFNTQSVQNRYVFNRARKVSYEGLNIISHGSQFHNSASYTQKH